MTERYSVETFMRIYEDDHGWFYEIRPDADGLGCVEVRYSDGVGNSKSLFSCPPKAAHLLANAIHKVALEMERVADNREVPHV